MNLPSYKIENNKGYKLQTEKTVATNGYIYYKYLSVDWQHLWEINPYAKKNILDLEFLSQKTGKFQNILYINIEGYDTIEIPIMIECFEDGFNLFHDFLNFGLYLEKNQVFY